MVEYDFSPRSRPRDKPASGIFDDPAVSICLNEDWIPLVSGLLSVLLQPEYWNGDPIDAIREVAALYAAMMSEAGDCGMSGIQDLRVKSGSPCIVEKLVDGVWSDAFDLSSCAETTTQDALDEFRDEIQQPGEVPDGSTPLGNLDCREVTVTIPANGQVVIPVRVEPGNHVRIVSAEGAWTSGRYSPVNLWYCWPDSLFYLGVCTGTPDANVGDIVVTSKEHAIIARYGSETFEITGAQQQISPTASQASLTLEMNDSAKGDNSGALTVVVEICGDFEDECVDPGLGSTHSDNLLTVQYGSTITASAAPVQQYPSGYWAFSPGTIITYTHPGGATPDRCVHRIADQFARFNASAGVDVRVNGREWLTVDMGATPTNGTLGPQVGRDVEPTYFLEAGGTVEYRVTGNIILMNSIAFYFYNQS